MIPLNVDVVAMKENEIILELFFLNYIHKRSQMHSTLL